MVLPNTFERKQRVKTVPKDRDPLVFFVVVFFFGRGGCFGWRKLAFCTISWISEFGSVMFSPKSSEEMIWRRRREQGADRDELRISCKTVCQHKQTWLTEAKTTSRWIDIPFLDLPGKQLLALWPWLHSCGTPGCAVWKEVSPGALLPLLLFSLCYPRPSPWLPPQQAAQQRWATVRSRKKNCTIECWNAAHLQRLPKHREMFPVDVIGRCLCRVIQGIPDYLPRQIKSRAGWGSELPQSCWESL